jgi:hypothetical protein
MQSIYLHPDLVAKMRSAWKPNPGMESGRIRLDVFRLDINARCEETRERTGLGKILTSLNVSHSCRKQTIVVQLVKGN